MNALTSPGRRSLFYGSQFNQTFQQEAYIPSCENEKGTGGLSSGSPKPEQPENRNTSSQALPRSPGANSQLVKPRCSRDGGAFRPFRLRSKSTETSPKLDISWPIAPATGSSVFGIPDYTGNPDSRPPTPRLRDVVHSRAKSQPSDAGPLKKLAKRSRNSTGSTGVTSAIKGLFHGRKKSKDRNPETTGAQQPISPRSERFLSHFPRLSKPASQTRLRKQKLRSASDPAAPPGSVSCERRPILRRGASECPLGIQTSSQLPPIPQALTPTNSSLPNPCPPISPSHYQALRYQPSSQDSADGIIEEELLPAPFRLTRPYRALRIPAAHYRNPTLTMEPPRTSRLLDPTSAISAITKHKAEAIKLAREQATAVQEMCRRAKTESPPYEFEELIGKGSYGRVYKGHQLPSEKIVAIKVMDIDSLDYKSVRDMKDESIKDFIHETKVMKQVKDAGAKNINELIEAISIHSQLWLVCEYCPGGSVRTLMRATNDRLDEKFAIPVARELAAGLRAIHDAGIIHRDIKAANVLIHEEGRLQICDFGVAGVLQSQLDKRSTWIGTPHWMPPEMFSTRGQAHQYGSEIDVWAYGCTLFELATGNPPNANLRERMQIGRQLNRTTPKLDNERYSDGLKSLVAFSLESDPFRRPSMADVQQHPYIANSEEEYPTSSLSELVRIYYQWSQRGGQRISLFHPGGAAAAEMPGAPADAEEDWNFSTTDGFEKRFSIIDLDQIAASLAEMEEEISPTKTQANQDSFDEPTATAMTKEDQVNFDERVRRGAEAMEGLFNEEMPSYTYETKNDFVPFEDKQPVSDLPLRTETDRSSVTSTFIDIDIGSFDSSHYAAGASSAQPFQLADADTIRANRSSGRAHRNSNESRSRSSSSGFSSNRDSQEIPFQPQTGPRPPTMDWKFPVFMQPPQEEEAETEAETQAPGPATPPEPASTEPDLAARRATMEWTFPVMTAAADTQDDSESVPDPTRYETLRAPVLELEPSATIRPSSIGEPGDSRPSTSASAKSSISISSDTDYDPFRFDRPADSPEAAASTQQPFFNDFPEIVESSDDAEEDRSSVLDGPGPDEEESPQEPFPAAHAEPLATARREPPLTARPGIESIQFPDLLPPRPEVLIEGADEGEVTAELDRLLGDFLQALSATGEALSKTTIEAESTRDVDSASIGEE